MGDMANCVDFDLSIHHELPAPRGPHNPASRMQRKMTNFLNHPNWYLWRNKWSLLVAVWLIVAIFTDYYSLIPNFPRWGRQRRLIRNVEKYSHLIPLESIERLPQFEDFVSRLHAVGRAPYIIFFDSNQLEVTKNHICNLRPLPGAVERLAAVAFDEASEAALKSFDPTIPIITVDFSLVRKTLPADLENKKYITYQLILMLRARVVTALAKRGLNFWAMQQDTIWTANFPAMNIEDQKREANLLFDTVGNDQFRIYEKMKNWICGSTFFVRGNDVTVEFFKLVAHLMTRRLSPDSSIMTYLCGSEHYKCATLPRWVISNSNFFMGNRRPVPFLIQVDHDSPLPKMELLRKWNLEFKYANGTCNPDAMKTVKEASAAALPEVRQRADGKDRRTAFMMFRLWLHEFLGFDPYNRKNFLRVHESLI